MIDLASLRGPMAGRVDRPGAVPRSPLNIRRREGEGSDGITSTNRDGGPGPGWSVAARGYGGDSKGSPRRGQAEARRLRAGRPADPLGQLLRLPRARRQGPQGRAAARHPGRGLRQAQERRPRDRAGQARRERADRPDRERRPRAADAAQEERQAVDGRAGRRAPAMGRARGDVDQALGVQAARRSPACPPSRTPPGRSTRSTGSSWPGSRPRGWRPSPRRARPR